MYTFGTIQKCTLDGIHMSWMVGVQHSLLWLALKHLQHMFTHQKLILHIEILFQYIVVKIYIMFNR